jgi:hypothetical protein
VLPWRWCNDIPIIGALGGWQMASVTFVVNQDHRRNPGPQRADYFGTGERPVRAGT